MNQCFVMLAFNTKKRTIDTLITICKATRIKLNFSLLFMCQPIETFYLYFFLTFFHSE